MAGSPHFSHSAFANQRVELIASHLFGPLNLHLQVIQAPADEHRNSGHQKIGHIPDQKAIDGNGRRVKHGVCQGPHRSSDQCGDEHDVMAIRNQQTAHCDPESHPGNTANGLLRIPGYRILERSQGIADSHLEHQPQMQNGVRRKPAEPARGKQADGKHENECCVDLDRKLLLQLSDFRLKHALQ